MCSICDHPDLTAINAAIRVGEKSLADIARERSLPYRTLCRHRRDGHPDHRGDHPPDDVPAVATVALEPESAFARLTPRHARFVEEYMVDLNARRAAIRAGYSATSADQTVWRLMNRADVNAALSELQAVRHQRTAVGAQWVIDQLLTVAAVDPVDVCKQNGLDVVSKQNGNELVVVKELSQIPPDIRRTIRKMVPTKYGMTIEFEPRMKAYELLLEAFGGRSQGAVEFHDLGTWDPPPTVDELQQMAQGVPAQIILRSRTITVTETEVRYTSR